MTKNHCVSTIIVQRVNHGTCAFATPHKVWLSRIVRHALESARLGPETLVDVLPDGRRRAARHPLEGGNDSVGTLSDATYIGDDSQTPEERTGLHSLRNIEDISIVACPGRTSAQIQNALIIHCELMRYRFAVLDGLRPPSDSLGRYSISTTAVRYEVCRVFTTRGCWCRILSQPTLPESPTIRYRQAAT